MGANVTSTLDSGSVRNVDINASAAITRSKLALETRWVLTHTASKPAMPRPPLSRRKLGSRSPCLPSTSQAGRSA